MKDPQLLSRMDTELYYAISGHEEVFCSREEALKALKHIKGARLKTFPSREDAEVFAREEDVTDAPPPAEAVDPSATPFPSLKVPALNAFRLAIEKGNEEKVKELLESNPRYLVDCGSDLPVLLQRGCHYNALHVVARSNKPEMARYLLDTLNSTEYWSKLYPTSTPSETDWRRKHVINHYLHALDKGVRTVKTGSKLTSAIRPLTQANREVPYLADYGYGYILAIRKVCTYSQSSAWPDFSDYGYGYVWHVFGSQKHAAAQCVVSSLTLWIGSRHFFSTFCQPYFVRNLPSAEPL